MGDDIENGRSTGPITELHYLGGAKIKTNDQRHKACTGLAFEQTSDY